MCGIFGIIDKAIDSKLDRERMLKIALHAIASRGPDGHGISESNFSNYHTLFAHTRLSIIDLSASGHQPMKDQSGDWMITYNGEIYNYSEIRQELEDLGHSFIGKSDTEVLLKGWIQWGIDFLNRANGMFSFAIINRKTGEVWLARDRFGVKPLLWGRLPNGGFVFSSSVSALAKILDSDVNVDYCAHGLRYKSFETKSSSTPFHGVNSLPAGAWLHIKQNDRSLDISQGCWYDLKTAVANRRAYISGVSDHDLLQQCHEILKSSVQIRLRSDVPVAVSLSAGLDSSSIAAIAATHLDDLQGFTYGSPDADLSEGPTVARFTKEIGIQANYIWPKYSSTDLDALLERTLACQEAPFPGLSVLAQNEVFRNVKQQGFKVLLGGQGGDESFAGYRKFFVVAMREAISRRDANESLHLIYSLGLMLLHEIGQAKLYWKALGRYRENANFTFDLLQWSAPSANLWGSPDGSLMDRQIDDIQQWSIPSLLRYEDRNSMGHGVESRLPFMDYRLVELALALRARLKIANGFGKWALRDIMKGAVPDFVRLNRKKRGFDVTQSWISDGLGASLRNRINENRKNLAPYLKKGVDINKYLTDDCLENNRNLLDEAIMLAWLTQPVRQLDTNGEFQ